MNTGRKFDEGKEKWSLLDYEIIREMVQVLTVGAKKYGDINYQKVDPKRYQDALMRHIVAMISGEENDPEDGLSHASHAMANLMFMRWHEKRKYFFSGFIKPNGNAKPIPEPEKSESQKMIEESEIEDHPVLRLLSEIFNVDFKEVKAGEKQEEKTPGIPESIDPNDYEWAKIGNDGSSCSKCYLKSRCSEGNWGDNGKHPITDHCCRCYTDNDFNDDLYCIGPKKSDPVKTYIVKLTDGMYTEYTNRDLKLKGGWFTEVRSGNPFSCQGCHFVKDHGCDCPSEYLKRRCAEKGSIFVD